MISFDERIGFFNSADAERRERNAVSIHEGPGQSKIIVQVEVDTTFSDNVIHALEREVNKAVKYIQDNKARR